MNLEQLIAQLRASLAPLLTERTQLRSRRDEIRAACVGESRQPSEEEATEALAAEERMTEIDASTAEIDAQIRQYEDELRRDQAADALQRQVVSTGVTLPGSEEREQRLQISDRGTYNRDADPNGAQFLRDVAAQFMHGAAAVQANERLGAHMVEARGQAEERGFNLDGYAQRAAGTGAFAGLVVPQYLTDMYAPMARAGRPLADAMLHHDLPETGMTAYIGRVTTGTTTGLQAAEFDPVNETDIDDTLMSIPIKTNAGSQTLSRQALDRGVGVEDTTMKDLFAAYDTTLDNRLINEATTGLSAVATTITYTDGTPTAAELYPKFLQAPAAVEAAMLNQDKGDGFAVFHSRRWFWAQSQLTSTWPLFGQPGVSPQHGGENYGEKYGAGFRGVLPAGTPVITDANVPTNLGAGTNEDEIYFCAKSESHLWEDPKAPMLIRAEQSQVKKLAVDFVAYGYFAYTFVRRPHAQKISGTGLVIPAWT